ncbi:MAG: hypothetical protein IKD08_04735 [Alphaproteobacteria bacterium]|nr:hypothetical protein [Alphaproteobacteria bacterium]
MIDLADIIRPKMLYRGQELNDFPWLTDEEIKTPAKSFHPRSSTSNGKTATGQRVGDAVFAASSYAYASVYTIPKVDSFSAGYIGYNINQNILIISNFAKTYYEHFPDMFGYVYTITDTEPFQPVVIDGMVAEWYSTETVYPSEATKINGLGDICQHNQVLYLSPESTWKDFYRFSRKQHGSMNELHNAIQEGLLISYNQEHNINCVDFKIAEESTNILQRLRAKLSQKVRI